MKFGKQSVVAGIAAVALSFSLAACGGGGTGSSGESTGKAQTNTDASKVPANYNAQPRANVKDGGTITAPITEIPDQLNAFNADGSGYTAQLWAWYNPQMMFFTPAGDWSFNKDYLTDVKSETKDGNLVVTYTINPKAKWNDGSPITWESFKTTWQDNSGKNPDFAASSTDGYSSIKTVTQGTDERQAVVTFDGTWAWWHGMFNNILNPHVNSVKVFNEGYVNNMHPEWGAGPYTVSSYDKKTGTVTFKQNPNWWGDKGKLDSMTYRQMEDTASINAFKNGEIDWTGVGTKDRLAQVKGMSNITIHRAGSVANRVLEVSGENPALKDPNVRKALMESIDRKTLDKIVFNGLDYSETPPGSFNLFPFQKGYLDAFTKAGYKAGAADANKLLDQAGWAKGSDGVRAKGGDKLSLSFPVIGDDPVTLAMGKAMVSMAKSAGIQLNMQQKPSADFSKVFTGGDWDVFFLSFVSSDPYGVAYMCQLYCSDSGLNLTKTGTKALDKQIKDVGKIADATEQTDKAMQLEATVMSKTWGLMPLYNGPSILATKKGLANVGAEPYFGPDLFRTGPVQDVGWQK
jgi:peptide/nickel transport system substrate-binding protein